MTHACKGEVQTKDPDPDPQTHAVPFHPPSPSCPRDDVAQRDGRRYPGRVLRLPAKTTAHLSPNSPIIKHKFDDSRRS